MQQPRARRASYARILVRMAPLATTQTLDGGKAAEWNERLSSAYTLLLLAPRLLNTWQLEAKKLAQQEANQSYKDEQDSIRKWLLEALDKGHFL